MKDLTESEVREIRQLQGIMLPREAGKMYGGRSAETIRKIWRRETHVNVLDAPKPVTDEETLASGARLLASLGLTLTDLPKGGQ